MNSQWLFALTFTYLIHSTIILSLCWLIVRFSKSVTPEFENRAWKYAAIAGFITATAQTNLEHLPCVELSIGSASQTEPVSASALAFNRRPAPSIESPSSEWKVSASLLPVETPIEGDRIDQATPASPGASPYRQAKLRHREPLRTDQLNSYGAPLISFKVIALAAAAIWAIAGLLWLIKQFLATHFRVACMSTAESSRALQSLNHLMEDNGLDRRIDLLIDPVPDAQPVALGFFTWRIILPEDMLDSLSDEEMRSVLSHELAHLVRHDYAWKIIGHGICAMAGFQPLNFLARRRWERASEYLCDQWATQHGVSRMGLAKCLTMLAERRLKSKAMLAVTATGTKPTLVRRVQCLVTNDAGVDPWQSKRRRRCFNAATVALAGIVILIAPTVRAVTPTTDEHLVQRPPELAASKPDQQLPISIGPVHSDLSLEDFESWVRLDNELKELLRDLEIAQELADTSGIHATKIKTLRALTESVKAKRNRIATEFGVGENE